MGPFFLLCYELKSCREYIKKFHTTSYLLSLPPTSHHQFVLFTYRQKAPTNPKKETNPNKKGRIVKAKWFQVRSSGHDPTNDRQLEGQQHNFFALHCCVAFMAFCLGSRLESYIYHLPCGVTEHSAGWERKRDGNRITKGLGSQLRSYHDRLRDQEGIAA